MNKFHQVFLISLAGSLLSMCVMCNTGYAQIHLEIQMVPDIQNSENRVGADLKQVKLTALVKPYSPDLQYKWAHTRDVGKFKGDPEGQIIFYIPPTKIKEELAIQDTPEEVTITVTVTDVSGKSAQQRVNFSLRAPVQQLVKIAQGYFDNRCFMDTAGKAGRCRDTAVNICKKILAIEADNPEALSLLRKIKDFYKEWGNGAWKRREKANVKKHYDSYLVVASYLPATELEAEKQDVENKLADLKMMEREKELRAKFQRYRELQKQKGKNEAFLDAIMAIAKIFGETDIDSFHTRVDRMLRMEREKMGNSLQEFNDRFAQLYRDFDSSRKEKSQRKEIIQTLRIIASLRELKRVYEHFSPKEDLGALNNKIERYEERFLK